MCVADVNEKWNRCDDLLPADTLNVAYVAVCQCCWRQSNRIRYGRHIRPKTIIKRRLVRRAGGSVQRVKNSGDIWGDPIANECSFGVAHAPRAIRKIKSNGLWKHCRDYAWGFHYMAISILKQRTPQHGAEWRATQIQLSVYQMYGGCSFFLRWA